MCSDNLRYTLKLSAAAIIISVLLCMFCVGCTSIADEDVSLGDIAPIENTPAPSLSPGITEQDGTLSPVEAGMLAPDATTALDNAQPDGSPAPYGEETEEMGTSSGVPSTTRSRATEDYSKDVTGTLYGKITAVNQTSGVWYVTLEKYGTNYVSVTPAPGTDSTTSYTRIDETATNETATLFINDKCTVELWTPYDPYTPATAATTISSLSNEINKTTEYGEPYLYRLTVSKGMVNELRLWTAYYESRMYEHGLAGVIYSDGSAVGGEGGLTPETAEKYKQREISGVVVEGRPTPTPTLNILIPQ